VETLDLQNVRVAMSRRVGRQARLGYRAPAGGTYYLEAKLLTRAHDPVQYRLALAKV
jgi:hypothetical protein